MKQQAEAHNSEVVPAAELASNKANSGSTAQAVDLVIGLDIGGSKTRGIVWRDGQVVVDATAGSANVQNVTVQTARENLSQLFAELLPPLDGQTPKTVFAGSGGIDTADDADALAALISPLTPGAQITVVHDTRLLLAAGGAAVGVAIISGTGSAAWGASESGNEARSGGWGYLLGDEGSGYWIARKAVRYSLQRMDQGLPVDELTTALLSYCELASPGELIAHFHGDTTRRYWAAAATAVIAAARDGHESAKAIIETAGADLAQMAAQVAGQLSITGPFVLGSGLGSNVPEIQQAFTRNLADRGYTEVRILDQDPIFGVPLLVEQQRSAG